MELSPLYHNTRPDGELLPQEAAAFDLLEQLGIDYDRVSSEPADTMEKCAAVSEVLGMPICKNLFLCNRQKTQFYLLCMEPDKPFHPKDLSAQIGSARLLRRRKNCGSCCTAPPAPPPFWGLPTTPTIRCGC